MSKVELIECPACGGEVSNQAESCANCGHPINKDRKGAGSTETGSGQKTANSENSSSSKVGWVIACILLAGLAFGVYAFAKEQCKEAWEERQIDHSIHLGISDDFYDFNKKHCPWDWPS